MTTQNQTAVCQLKLSFKNDVSGQEIVEENPANTVMPAITLFALVPKNETAVAKAES